ncbi:MAG: S-adenosylmethionine:tRNA ribosyltransferase-isomerase [Actinomycetota bacterium]
MTVDFAPALPALSPDLATAVPELSFDLAPDRSASEPPEASGLPRDSVRLLVARPDKLTNVRMADLAAQLDPGDLLVVNTSATLAAALDGTRADGRRVAVHFSTALDDGSWLVELRPVRDATGPLRDIAPGELVRLPAGVVLTVLLADPGGRLWRARIGVEGGVERYLARHGRPISYSYVPRRWPLTAYQTVFAREPGSAEMPSAGRPFTSELVVSLVTSGITIAPVTLHAGVSSLERGEPPLAERYRVPEATARLVNDTRAAGGRVVAVGTTVTRALESVADKHGNVTPGAGWTTLVLGVNRPARVVSGLVTGWHAPGASHLALLEALAGAPLVSAAYREALRRDYLWHEFGDSCLLLP